jgi:hypothetical protein
VWLINYYEIPDDDLLLLIYDAVYLAAVMQLQDAYEHELGGM